MQRFATHSTRSARRRPTTASALLGLSLGTALAGGHAAQAQVPACTLSLTTLTPTVAVGGVITFTVNLTGGTGLGQYNLNMLIDPTLMKFVNIGSVSTPNYFTNTDTGQFSFEVNQVNTTVTTAGVPVGGDLNVAAGNFGAIDNVGPTALGTFQVQVLSALPLTGNLVSFGPIGPAGGFGGTAVSDGNVPANNELTAATGVRVFTLAAPEPSQTAALSLGVLGLAGLVLRARKTKRSV